MQDKFIDLQKKLPVIIIETISTNPHHYRFKCFTKFYFCLYVYMYTKGRGKEGGGQGGGRAGWV